MFARRATTTTMNRRSRTRYGPQIRFANSSARGRRDATASSCETAVTTVKTVIPALTGDSAMVSIRLKLFHRLQALDLLVEKAMDDSCIITRAVKRIVGDKLRLAKERAADTQDGASRRYQQRRRRRPAKLSHRSEEHMSELQSRGHLVCRLLL